MIKKKYGGCYILQSKHKKEKKWNKAGPYVFKRKSDFGSLHSLKKSNPNLYLRIKKVRC